MKFVLLARCQHSAPFRCIWGQQLVHSASQRMLHEVSTTEMIMSRLNYFQRESEWLASIPEKKMINKEKTQEAETSTEEEAYKSDKKHLKRGLQVENILIIPIAWEKHQNNLAVCVTRKLIKLI